MNVVRLAVLAACIFMGGCAFNPNKEFSSFSPEQFGEKEVLVVVDTMKLDDVAGEHHVVNLEVNAAIADRVIKSATKVLNEKRYRVSEQIVRTVGLMVQPDTAYMVVESGLDDDGETGWDDDHNATFKSAPFFTDFGPFPETAEQHLGQAHQNVMAIATEQLDDLGPIGVEGMRLDTYSGILLLQAYGVEVPAGKSVAQGMLTAVMTLGWVAVWEQSTSTFSATLIDPADGHVVWANRYYVERSERDPDEINKVVERILRDLPQFSALDLPQSDPAESTAN
ncbi:MAG: hypothetical protein AAGH65_00150 [Pseudomonadota bacterium]